MITNINIMENIINTEEKAKGDKPLISHKKCIHCKEDILSDAKVCKHCGKAQPSKAAVFIVLIFLVFIFIVSIIGSFSAPTNSDRETDSKIFAKEVIKEILKSPSTAEFSNVRAYELSNEKDVWVINGYVDSQNGFGAVIRSVWEVQLDYRNEKGGTVESVFFDGKKVL